ncbi:hypothetical protein JFN87_32515 [Streptomyces bomunensis]|uniref:Uncharacterized protein n=1 Tax=Streptomyces montanisoli TaxID=2798581 RepID=A0A940S199_9ACTN|nr:hypothetical protein [Streptomyces montanisoli]
MPDRRGARVADHDADPEPQPLDEDAAWAAIVAGYGEEPADPPGARPFKSVDDLASLDSKTGGAPNGAGEPGDADAADAADAADRGDGGDDAEGGAESGSAGPGDAPVRGLGSSVVFAPGVGAGKPAGAARGPRDFTPAEDDDEGHFVPPEPPPLPESDVTAKFAWMGAIGGPVLALAAVILQWDMTWWLTTLCAGGFLGGIATLVARMEHDNDEDDDDPGHGAVV